MKQQEIVFGKDLKLFFYNNYINLKHGDVLYPCRSIMKATNVVCEIYEKKKISRKILLRTLAYLGDLTNFPFGGINQIKYFNLICVLAEKPIKKMIEEIPVFEQCGPYKYFFISSSYKSDVFSSKEGAIDQLYVALNNSEISETVFFKLHENIPLNLPETREKPFTKKVLLN